MEYLDYATDIDGRLLHRLGLVAGLPDFVKKASEEDLVPPRGAGPDIFADPARGLLPCHTKAACWLSSAYFHEQRPALSKDVYAFISDRLEKMAAFHGISLGVKEARSKIESFRQLPDERELPDDDFALVYEDEGGRKVRRYPLRSSPEIKAAGEHYLKFRASAPFPLRRLFAEKVLEKAAAVGAYLPGEDELSRAAGRGACSAEDAARLLFDRVVLSRGGPGAYSPLQEAMLKLAKEVLERPEKARNREAMLQLAEVVDGFDESYRLKGHYQTGLGLPEDVLFGVTKQAVARLVEGHIETRTGNLYKAHELTRLRVREIREGLGEKYASELTRDGVMVDAEKAASVLPGMPEEDAALFDVLCQENGVQPSLRAAREVVDEHVALFRRAMAGKA
ncbi:MAG: hypothetical protein E6G97_18755 [Alphaproteobacteria bacterium]|nr:MAG: hypothetical protein E6G97_18755 [Alphaproteobacteria bacterium]